MAEILDAGGQHKCGYDQCECQVSSLETYCSDYCSDADDAQEMERYRTLRLKLLGVERSVVLGLRRDGRINATLLRTIERDLDLEEARLSGS